MSTTTRSSVRPGSRRDVLRRFASSRHQDSRLLAALVVLPLAILVAVALAPATMPITSLMVPLLLGSLLLPPRRLPWFVLLELAVLMVCAALQPVLTTKVWGAIGIQILMCLIVLAFSLRRSRLGVGGALGESMFVDLRDRILAQAGIPQLPAGWHVDRALRSAGGTPFAGDFLVAAAARPDRLEIVVVDVSGKGEDAGPRALLLSGAFGGLLGALPPEQFLVAANDYLLRQDWEEGFATAVHLTLDLGDGTYELRTAGHPPAVQRVSSAASGAGQWAVLESEGPVLGLMPDDVFAPSIGRLADGDALLLYTDGMVEEPRRDIEIGIDRLVTEAERVLALGVRGSARRLVDAVGSRDDDRALVVVSRT